VVSASIGLGCASFVVTESTLQIGVRIAVLEVTLLSGRAERFPGCLRLLLRSSILNYLGGGGFLSSLLCNLGGFLSSLLNYLGGLLCDTLSLSFCFFHFSLCFSSDFSDFAFLLLEGCLGLSGGKAFSSCG